MSALPLYCRAAGICLSRHGLHGRYPKIATSLNLLSTHQRSLSAALVLRRPKSSVVKPVEQRSNRDGTLLQNGDSLATDTQPQSRQQSQLSFQGSSEEFFGDYRVAYKTKSTWELTRALSCFLLCRFPSFADNALKIMNVTYSVLGRRLADFFIGRTVYAQFVAGETIEEMTQAIAKLHKGGVGPILCCPTECYSEQTGMTEEEFYDLNLEKVLDSIDKATLLNDPFPMVQYKFTAFVSMDLMIAISPLCQETTHDPDVIQGFVAAMDGKSVDFQKLPGWESFPAESTEELLRGLRRVGKINKELQKHDIVALTDAEYTNTNPALRVIGLASMKQCNSDGRAKVFYTYQAYLKAKSSQLEADLKFAQASGFSMGVKLVRGAYMVQERQRAKDGGYPDPVNPDFQATFDMYHACLDLLLNSAASNSGVRFIIASHNEDTALYAVKRVEELGIPKADGTVFFGQLYGMADHVSFVLGTGGYSVYKSIPYGSINDTLPYLSRRAQENKAILVNARRERKLIVKTLKDRAFFRG